MRYFFFLIFLISCQKSYILDNFDFTLNKSESLYSLRDNKNFALKDIYSNHKGLVLFFWQNSCPCVKRYQRRMIDLWSRYHTKDIGFFFIASNINEEDHDIKSEYERRQIPFDILRDKNGLLAKALKVKGTPTSVLIDQKGNVAFMGWIDNERDINEKNRKSYLEDAIKELLEEKPISKPTSPMFGCPII